MGYITARCAGPYPSQFPSYAGWVSAQSYLLYPRYRSPALPTYLRRRSLTLVMHIIDDEIDEDRIWDSIIDWVQGRAGTEEGTEGTEGTEGAVTATTFKVEEDLAAALAVSP
jgi:hypothetical protein